MAKTARDFKPSEYGMIGAAIESRQHSVKTEYLRGMRPGLYLVGSTGSKTMFGGHIIHRQPFRDMQTRLIHKVRKIITPGNGHSDIADGIFHE